MLKRLGRVVWWLGTALLESPRSFSEAGVFEPSGGSNTSLLSPGERWSHQATATPGAAAQVWRV